MKMLGLPVRHDARKATIRFSGKAGESAAPLSSPFLLLLKPLRESKNLGSLFFASPGCL